MNPQTLQTICQILVAFGLFVAAIAGYGAYYFGTKVEEAKERKSAQAGTLTPVSVFDRGTTAKGHPKFYFGDTESCFIPVGNPVPALFRFFGRDLTIKLIEGKITVSMDFRDSSGKMIAQLRNNDWKVNPNNSWDRNFTNDILEVLDADGQVMMQVKVVDEGVRMQCKVFGPNGECAALWSMNGPDGPGGAMFVAYDEEQRKVIPDIPPMFEYPSELHIGELASERIPLCGPR